MIQLLVLLALSAEPVTLPPYESVKGIERYATAKEYSEAKADKRFRLEKIAYQSDGLRVFAYIYAPVLRPELPMPTVIYNRGSYVRDDFGPELLTSFRRLALPGFVVIAPMYRQSGGGEGRDELGGADLNDLMNIRSVIAELPYVDPDRLFMYGESRGGMMTFQAIRDGFPVRAAATVGAFTELAPMVEANRKLSLQIWPDYESNAAAIRQRRSAIAWPEKLNVPLLILQGGADPQVNPSQSIDLASRLQALGKTYELIIKAGEGHILSGWREQRDAAAIEWFRRFMPPAARTP